MPQHKSIFAFNSYREFLIELFKAERNTAPRTTARSFAEALGMSAAALQMITSGKRNLSPASMVRLIKALRLSPAEASHFETMVSFEQSTDNNEREYFSKKLTQCASERMTEALVLPSGSLIEYWFVPALLVYLLDFVRDHPQGHGAIDFAYLSEKLGVDSKKVENVVNHLFELDVLNIDSKNTLHIRVERIAASIVQRKYLKETLAESARRIDREFENPLCFFNAHTFSIDQYNIKSFIDDYKRLIDKYITLHTKTTPDTKVVQAGIQFFPVF